MDEERRPRFVHRRAQTDRAALLLCSRCGGRRNLLAVIHDRDPVRRVLVAIGLGSKLPLLAAARGPPGQSELRGSAARAG